MIDLYRRSSVRLPVLAGVIAMLSLGQCLAAGKLSYGSRTGMTVTIIEMSGIDTAKAIIKTQHTREDARLFCTDYLGRPGDECIDKVLSEIKISDSIRGDCNSGQFVNLSGQSMLFAGPNLDYDAVQFSSTRSLGKATRQSSTEVARLVTASSLSSMGLCVRPNSMTPIVCSPIVQNT